MLPLHVTLVKVKWFLVSRVQLLSDKSELEDTQSASSMSPSVGLFDDGSPPPRKLIDCLPLRVLDLAKCPNWTQHLHTVPSAGQVPPPYCA